MGMNRKTLGDLRERLSLEEDSSERIGLMNTNKRIQIAYGDDYGIQIRSKKGFGTAVYIRVPLS
ncbi:MAG TPA: hypothetical protein VL921_20245 [Candidatus Udaeobacter sp.]|nr:hypothetical protein [Candidatus Udaeobacter sp.]